MRATVLIHGRVAPSNPAETSAHAASGALFSFLRWSQFRPSSWGHTWLTQPPSTATAPRPLTNEDHNGCPSHRHRPHTIRVLAAGGLLPGTIRIGERILRVLSRSVFAYLQRTPALTA